MTSPVTFAKTVPKDAVDDNGDRNTRTRKKKKKMRQKREGGKKKCFEEARKNTLNIQTSAGKCHFDCFLTKRRQQK